MKSKIIIGILIVAVLAGAVFYFTQSGKEQVLSENPTSLAQPQTPIVGGQKIAGSMKDLVAKGESLRCVFNRDTQFAKTLGYVYVADGKVRADFTVTPTVAQAAPFTASMIADNDTSYVWSSVMKDGFKIPTKTELEPKSEDIVDGVDYSQTLDFTCEKWSKDFGAFNPPANISFVTKQN